MATNEKIKLDITSAFDPGGFAKANRAVSDLGNEMKKGGKVANNLMDAFGDLGGSLGGVTSSISKLGSAFRGGGWIALAAAGVVFLVTKVIELKEAAEKAAEEMRKAWRDDLIKRMDASLSDLKTKHAQIADEIERGAKNAERIAKAYEALAKSEVGVNNAKTDAEIATMEGQKQAALLGVEDPSERKSIEMEWERKISDKKREAAKFERDQNKSMAEEKVKNAQKELQDSEKLLSTLIEKEKGLKDILSEKRTEEYNKQNPMPIAPRGLSAKEFAVGSVGGIATLGPLALASLAVEKEYQIKMDAWIKESAEFTKEEERRKKEAADELVKTQAAIKDTVKSREAADIGISSAKRGVEETSFKNIASKTREDNAQQASENNKIELTKELNKALQDQQNIVDKEYTVKQRIIAMEEKLLRVKEKEEDRIEKRNQLIQNSAQAKSMGAVGWNQDQTDKADAQKAMGKSNQKEANWVSNAKKRQATGAKLSEKELARIANFDQWDNNQIEQPNEKKDIDNIKERSRKGFFVSEKEKARVEKFDKLQEDRKNILAPNDPQKTMIARLEDNITELKGLRTDLQNSLKVK